MNPSSGVRLDEEATLRWTVTNPDTCVASFSGPGTSSFTGPQPAAGSLVLGPFSEMGLHTWTLSSTNHAGTTEDSASLDIGARATPVIQAFTASPNPVERGSATTLSWNAQHATRCRLNGASTDLPASGSVQRSPNSDTNYTLTCFNGPGSSAPLASQSANVAVHLPLQIIDHYAMSQADCPASVNTTAEILQCATDYRDGNLSFPRDTVGSWRRMRYAINDQRRVFEDTSQWARQGGNDSKWMRQIAYVQGATRCRVETANGSLTSGWIGSNPKQTYYIWNTLAWSNNLETDLPLNLRAVCENAAGDTVTDNYTVNLEPQPLEFDFEAFTTMNTNELPPNEVIGHTDNLTGAALEPYYFQTIMAVRGAAECAITPLTWNSSHLTVDASPRIIRRNSPIGLFWSSRGDDSQGETIRINRYVESSVITYRTTCEDIAGNVISHDHQVTVVNPDYGEPVVSGGPGSDSSGCMSTLHDPPTTMQVTNVSASGFTVGATNAARCRAYYEGEAIGSNTYTIAGDGDHCDVWHGHGVNYDFEVPSGATVRVVCSNNIGNADTHATRDFVVP